MDNFHGSVCWTELMTRDTAAAIDYYTKVLGWRVETMPMGHEHYFLFWRGDDAQPTAGMMAIPDDPDFAQMPAHWFTYLAVDDVDARVEETLRLGGTVKKAPFDIPDVGRIAIVTDPTGATFGMMKPIPPATG